MNVLMSYHYEKRPEFYLSLVDSGMNVLVDSGAFSADRIGAQIDVDDYAKMLKEVDGKVAGYFTLDVMRNPEASKEQHAYLRSLGLRPIPVYQNTSLNFSDVEEFLDGEDYVAIGSLVKSPHIDKTSGFNEIRISEFLRIQRQVAPEVKVHLLGYVRKTTIKEFAPYSVDSIGRRPDMFGGPLLIYDGGTWLRIPYPDRGKVKQLSRGDLKTAARIAKLYGITTWKDLPTNFWRGLGITGYMRWSRKIAAEGGTLIYSAVIPEDLTDSVLPMAVRLGWIKEDAPCLKFLK